MNASRTMSLIIIVLLVSGCCTRKRVVASPVNKPRRVPAPRMQPSQKPTVVVDPQYTTDMASTLSVSLGERITDGALWVYDVYKAFSGEKPKKRKPVKLASGREEHSTNYRRFTVDGKRFLLVTTSSRYLSYRLDRSHKPEGDTAKDYAAYATPDDAMVRALALALVKGVPREAQAGRIVRFVQGIGYNIGTESYREFIKYPVETLCEGGGDCEDLSMLAISLLAALDHDAVFVCVPPKPGSRYGHALMGIPGTEGQTITHKGKTYTLVELTGPLPVGTIAPFWRTLDWKRADSVRIAAKDPVLPKAEVVDLPGEK